MGTTRRWLLCVITAVLLIALPRRADAIMMQSSDIASLAFDAKEIVLVEKLRRWELKDEYRTFETVRVKQSYAGSVLQPGDELTIEVGCYGLEPMYGWDRNKPTPVVSDERVVFLSPHQKNRFESLDSGAPEMKWELEASGMRIFVDGHVNRYLQESNPGCYGPVPGEGPPYTLAEFASALGPAIATANEAHTWLDAAPSPERTEKLLALVGPAVDAPASIRRTHAWRDRQFGQDHIASKIIQSFAEAHDLGSLLEAVSRTSRIDLYMMSMIDFPGGELAAAARNTALPVRQRVSALQLFIADLANWRDPSIAALFTTMLSDPAPELRLAALDAHFTSSKPTPDGYLAALVAQFEVEKDLRVRFGILERAKREKIANKLTVLASELPLASGRQKSGNLVVAWAVVDGEAGTLNSLTIELQQDGRVASREDVSEGYSSTMSGTDAVSLGLPNLTVPPGVAPGRYDVFVDLKIDRGGPPIRRRLAIGMMDLDERAPKVEPVPAPLPSASAKFETPVAPAVVDAPIVEQTRAWSSLPWPRIVAGGLFGMILGLLVVQRRRKRV